MPSSTNSATSPLTGLEGVDLDQLQSLPPDERKKAEDALRKITKVRERNPLVGFTPHPKQQQFLASKARTKLFIGGNQSGKSVCGLLDWILQAVPREFVPDHLQ